MSVAKTIRPPVKWHGGKHYLAKRIVALLPDHHTYVEPFGGGASILLNKPPALVEIYNDLDRGLVNLFWVLRNHGAALCQALTLTPYSEEEFMLESTADKTAARAMTSAEAIEQARSDFVRWRQSIGGRGDSFSCTLHRVRRGMADVVSGYLSAIDEVLPAVIERLRRVQILCRPALDVILKWDSPETLFYCDPPYVHSTREGGSRAAYGHEMTDSEHEGFADALRACSGAVVLSGYDSELYRELYRGWRRVTFEVANHAAGGKTKRRMTECVWIKDVLSDE